MLEHLCPQETDIPEVERGEMSCCEPAVGQESVTQPHNGSLHAGTREL